MAFVTALHWSNADNLLQSVSEELVEFWDTTYGLKSLVSSNHILVPIAFHKFSHRTPFGSKLRLSRSGWFS